MFFFFGGGEVDLRFVSLSAFFLLLFRRGFTYFSVEIKAAIYVSVLCN